MTSREQFEAWAEEVGALPWGYLKKQRTQNDGYSVQIYNYMWSAWQASREAVQPQNEPQNTPKTIPAGDAAKAIAKTKESTVNKTTARIPDHMMELIVPTTEYLNLELRRLRSEVRRIEALKKAVSGAVRQLAKGGC